MVIQFDQIEIHTKRLQYTKKGWFTGNLIRRRDWRLSEGLCHTNYSDVV